MATATVNHEGLDIEAYNRWMAEFNVSSRYVKPMANRERHYFDASLYGMRKKKSVTFYYKIVSIVKSIL
jgi:hypothetical protein